MGTRLYPATNDPSTLEQIAGVAFGTYNHLKDLEVASKKEGEKKFAWRMSQLRKANPETLKNVLDQRKALLSLQVFHEFNYAADWLYDQINADQDLLTLNHLLSEGWGKFTFFQQNPNSVPMGMDVYGGCTKDKTLVGCLLLSSTGFKYGAHMGLGFDNLVELLVETGGVCWS